MNWQEFIKLEMQKDYFHNLDDLLREEEKKYTIYPSKDNIFKAFDLCPLDKVKVVILGQDCYFNPGEAMGLAFSVPSTVSIPSSLRNIFTEIKTDLNFDHKFTHGDLIEWAKQGVLLLNSALTVRKGEPGSHSKYGWWQFTDNAIKLLNSLERPIVFLLWGAHAKSKTHLITNEQHLVLQSAHPSGLSAHKGFFGNKHFSKTNDFLIKNNIEPIQWLI